MLADSAVSLGQIWAPVVSAVLVAGITAIATIVTTRANRNKAKGSADEAEKSAGIAADAAKALEVKNAIIEGLDQRVEQLETDNRRCEERCDRLETKNDQMQVQIEEMMEALRNASLLERELSKSPSSTADSPIGSVPTSPEPSS